LRIVTNSKAARGEVTRQCCGQEHGRRRWNLKEDRQDDKGVTHAGMGEVFRAHDSKLGRDVALKFLPAHFTSDQERRARFAREARVLATLNHPNIGSIYGFEEADGLSALVLELVEGPTLADRLRQGAMKLFEALAVARQIAEALEAAHDKGIVHRDLKPANVVLQSAGALGASGSDMRAKVLDFGLAKPIVLLGPDAPTVHPAGSFDRTAEGRIVGTPMYMSPEQTRGRGVDKRTDIWAFGCVLFEMLSRKRPFEGDTATDTFARILEHEPDWSLLPPTTPPAARKLLKRCLEKDLSRRLRDIGRCATGARRRAIALPVIVWLNDG
jgi:serine/threonine-protein kinase